MRRRSLPPGIVDDVMRTREEIAGLLAQTDAATVIALADQIVAGLAGDTECTVTRSPQVGAVQVQVREPIASHRFVLADAIATNVEIQLRGQGGWGLRLGDDTVAVTAQAICDAEYAASGPLSTEVLRIAEQTHERLRDERISEWHDLQPTIVEFEEVN